MVHFFFSLFCYVAEPHKTNFTITENHISCADWLIFIINKKKDTKFQFSHGRGHLSNECQSAMFFFSLVSWKIPLLSTKKTSQIAMMQDLHPV